MGAQPVELQQEVAIEMHSAVLADIDFGHPAANAVRVELLVPCGIERIGEIDTAPIAADLHHLRATIESSVLLARMGRAAHDAADLYGADEARTERIRYIVPLQLTCAPAGDVQVPVVE